MINAEQLAEAKAAWGKAFDESRATLKQVKARAKEQRDKAQKDAPDKAAKKAAEAIYKQTVKEAEQAAAEQNAKALEEWQRVYQEYQKI